QYAEQPDEALLALRRAPQVEHYALRILGRRYLHPLPRHALIKAVALQAPAQLVHQVAEQAAVVRLVVGERHLPLPDVDVQGGQPGPGRRTAARPAIS